MQQLHFETHGTAGPHLLLVHGFLMSRAQWLPNLQALSEVCRPGRRRTAGVTVDRARRPMPPPIIPTLTSPRSNDIRRSLGIERWWLCGYSLGAGLTIRYALTHPDRVFGHAFTNSTSAFADAEQTDAWQNGAGEAAQRIDSGGIDAIERMPVHPRHAKRLPRGSLRRADDRRGAPEPARHRQHAALHQPQRHRSGARAASNIAPALLICGREETRFAPHREFAQTQMPNLSIVDLPVGHGVNMEDPPVSIRRLSTSSRDRSLTVHGVTGLRSSPQLVSTSRSAPGEPHRACEPNTTRSRRRSSASTCAGAEVSMPRAASAASAACTSARWCVRPRSHFGGERDRVRSHRRMRRRRPAARARTARRCGSVSTLGAKRCPPTCVVCQARSPTRSRNAA